MAGRSKNDSLDSGEAPATHPPAGEPDPCMTRPLGCDKYDTTGRMGHSLEGAEAQNASSYTLVLARSFPTL
jgi:hypothetical protein